MAETHLYSASLDAYWVAIEAPTPEARAAWPEDTIEVPPPPGADHVWRDGRWEHVAPPPPDPAAARERIAPISRRQLLIGLAARGWITEKEAVAAAAAGALPKAAAAAVATLPAEEQPAARITWAAMSAARRLDPLVELLAAGQGLTPEEVDAFFTDCAKL